MTRSADEECRVAVQRSNQVFFEQIAEREFLDFGVALYDRDRPWLADVNQVIDVRFEDSASRADLATGVEQVESHYQEWGLRCLLWRTAFSQDLSELGALLADRNYAPRMHRCLVLAEPREIEAPADVEVQSARAFRTQYRALQRDRGGDCVRPEHVDEYAEAAFDRLSDQRLDAFVAMVDRKAAGVASLLTVGDIGRIIDIHVADDFSDYAVTSALMSRVIAESRQVRYRCVCLEADDDDAASIDRFLSMGFRDCGAYTTFALNV
jgi:ribosomal protein S18 acetylase RimI-like enzyme